MSNQKQVVSWRCLPGNKFNRALHPAMLSKDGYCKSMPISYSHGQQLKEVVYDRDYVIEWVALKVFKALDGKSFAEIVEILEEAHDSLLVKEYGQHQLPVSQYDEWAQP